VGIPTPSFDGLEEIYVGRRPGGWHVAAYYDDNGTPEPNGWAGCREPWEVVSVVSDFMGAEEMLKEFLLHDSGRGIDVYYDKSPDVSCFVAYAYQSGSLGYQGYGYHGAHLGAMVDAIKSFFDEAVRRIDSPLWERG